MAGVLSRRYWAELVAARLAAMPDRRGVRWLLRLHDRLFYYMLGVIKQTEGGLHPKHRVTDLHAFFRDAVAPEERVLDLGCGYGEVAAALAERCASVTGVDRREEAIARARSRHRRENLTFVVGDLHDLPAEPVYDVVVLSNVLEHIRDRDALLRRCGALGRRLLVRVPAADRDWLVPYRRELGLDWRLHPDHVVEYTEETLRAELVAAGYRVDRTWCRFGAVHAVAERA